MLRRTPLANCSSPFTATTATGFSKPTAATAAVRLFGSASTRRPFFFFSFGAAAATTAAATAFYCYTTGDTASCNGAPPGQSHVQHPAYPPKMTPEEKKNLPLFSLEEVQKHKAPEDGIWVTYNGFVYDVTPFVMHHPGGKELLLTAGGLDLEHFFEHYKVHTKTDKAISYLDGMKIGRLTAADARRAVRFTTPQMHVERRMKVLGNARFRLSFVVALLPLWLLLRTVIRFIGLVIPPLGHLLAGMMPVSVPGYGDARPVPSVDPKTGKRTKVAVVGGGIAGCTAAWSLSRDGYDVTVFEGRKNLSGNAHTFDWNVGNKVVKTCVSVTAWPPILYKNYTALLQELGVKTKPQFLSWFVNSKVPNHEGHLWGADPAMEEGSLRVHFKKDFEQYGKALGVIDWVTYLFTFGFLHKEPSIYTLQTGLGPLNPFAAITPIYTMARLFGVSQEWWDIVFTPYYTASFLTDKLDNMVGVVGPVIERQIPLLPNATNSAGTGEKTRVTTCDTWENAGDGIREVFSKLTAKCNVRVNTRVIDVKHDDKSNTHIVTDDTGGCDQFDRVVFACQATAISNMLKDANWMEEAILATPEYADDHHPGTGHMHAIMHNDASIIDPKFRDDVLRRGSNYVEVTRSRNGELNIENTYNFGVQTPSLLNRADRPPLLITHALGEGKTIDPKKIVGDGNHVRAHPLYSGWNVAAMLSLRLAQGRRGVYYCGNWTTPGNAHDPSCLSGLNVARAIGAEYPFTEKRGYRAEVEADLHRLNQLQGI